MSYQSTEESRKEAWKEYLFRSKYTRPGKIRINKNTMNGSVDKFAYPRQARKLGSVQYDIDVSAIEWNYIIALTIIIKYMLASKYFHFHKVADLSCSRMGGNGRYNWNSCSRRKTRLSVFCGGACHNNGVYHVQHWQPRICEQIE